MKKRTKVVIIINLIICLISLISLFFTTKNLKTINSINDKFEYIRIEENRVALNVKEKAVVMAFNERSVEVFNSYKITEREDQLRIVLFIKHYAEKNGIEITRSNEDIMGEFRLHNYANALGINEESSKDVDIDYIKDERVIVSVFSKLLGVVGI